MTNTTKSCCAFLIEPYSGRNLRRRWAVPHTTMSPNTYFTDHGSIIRWLGATCTPSDNRGWLWSTWLDRHSEVGKVKMTNHMNAWLHGRERRRHTSTPPTRARHVFEQGFTGKEPVYRNSRLVDLCEFLGTLTLLWPKWHKLKTIN